MSLCPNCGNPWLESYEAAGKCDACGNILVVFPSAETVGMTGGNVTPDPEV